MAVKSAKQIIAELKEHIRKMYPEEQNHRGFLLCVAENNSSMSGIDFYQETNMERETINMYHERALGAIIGFKGEDTNELPRPERMHSDRCRTAIRSSKDSNNAN